jgi:hypothetical protein
MDHSQRYPLLANYLGCRRIGKMAELRRKQSNSNLTFPESRVHMLITLGLLPGKQ